MESLFGTIPSVLGGLQANVNVDEAVVLAAWKRIAGELLRERTEPIGFFENRLVVAVTDETWARHLEDLSPQMLAKLNIALGHGKVKFIEFRIDASTVNAIREANKIDAAEPETFEVHPSLIVAAGAIADEHLREQFLSAAANYLAKSSQP